VGAVGVIGTNQINYMWDIEIPEYICVREVNGHVFLFNDFTGQTHVTTEHLTLLFKCLMSNPNSILTHHSLNHYITSNNIDVDIDWNDIVNKTVHAPHFPKVVKDLGNSNFVFDTKDAEKINESNDPFANW
jgi:hypothetical protein